MGSHDRITDLVEISGPEDLPEVYLSQPSVEKFARDLHTIISRKDSLLPKLEQVGTRLRGCCLLIGPTGCDFETFVYYLVREVPLNLIQIRLRRLERSALSEQLIEAIEFSKRNAPSILYIPNLNLLAEEKTFESQVLKEELLNIGWDSDEVIVVAATTYPENVDRDLLSVFDKTYQLLGSTQEDRIQLLDQILEDRNEFDSTLIAELTQDWSFNDVKKLAVSLLSQPVEESKQMTHDQLEELIIRSGVMPVGSESAFHSFIAVSKKSGRKIVENLESDYPDEFLDQLYLMAVGEDYQQTQDVIETLNANLPLTEKNREFLSRHPYILSGSSEERLTRLLRAKKASDRLRRVLGRQQ